MRRLLAIALPTAALLIGGAPAAVAKGVADAKVCGADGCRTIAAAGERLLQNGPPAAAPKAAEPFVRLEMRVGMPGHLELVELSFLPRSGLVLLEDGTWARPLALAELREQARRVTPLAASELPASALEAPARPAPAPAAPQSQPGGGLDALWVALAAAVLALAAGLGLARRRRARPVRAAGATG